MSKHPHIEEARRRYRAGCRCDACRAGWAAYNRQQRKGRTKDPEGRDTRIPARLRAFWRCGVNLVFSLFVIWATTFSVIAILAGCALWLLRVWRHE